MFLDVVLADELLYIVPTFRLREGSYEIGGGIYMHVRKDPPK